ncbi:MAG: hypothetical protein EBT75_00595 [Proteobacteria bacterium]|nr:hypothetical protein [Pseudomonadota bacterium]NBS05999.1 hypothetical protein [Verrucomicrobiota bacterium]
MFVKTSAHPVSARQTVISATITAWLYRGINLATGIVTLPLIAAHLGKEDLGVWLLVGNLVSFVSLSDFGVGSSIGRFVARYRQTDPDKLPVLLSTAFGILVVITSLLLLLTLLLSGLVASLLKVPSGLVEDTRFTFLFGGGAAALLLLLRGGGGILAGHQRYGPHGTGKILEALLSFFAVVMLAKADRLDLRHLAVTTAAVTVVSNIGLVWVSWKMTGPWGLRVSQVRLDMVREIFSLGFSSLGLSLSTVLYAQGIGLLIGITYGLQAAAIYGVCFLLVNNIQALLSSLGVSFSTLASEWQGRNELGRAVVPTRTVSVAISALAACALAGLVSYGEPILRLLFHHSDWSAEDYLNARLLLLTMTTGLMISLPYTAIKSTLLGTGQHWKVFMCFLSSAVIAIAAAFLAAMEQAPLWQIGLAWSLFWLLPAVTVFPVWQSRQAGVTPGHIVWQVHAPGALAGILLALFSQALSYWWWPSNPPTLLGQILICIAVGGILTVLAIRGFLLKIFY